MSSMQEKSELPITSNTISFHPNDSHISDKMWAMHLSHSQLNNDISFPRERLHCHSHNCCELQYSRPEFFSPGKRGDFYLFIYFLETGDYNNN